MPSSTASRCCIRTSRTAEAYLDFAAANPELYRVMFAAPTTLVFADPSTPAQVQAGFAEVLASVASVGR
ncbi:MAG: WHG domain-containing protein [Microlunatus sp.]|nr:WHG domain-containing protein [Microlunatus sp.]